MMDDEGYLKPEDIGIPQHVAEQKAALLSDHHPLKKMLQSRSFIYRDAQIEFSKGAMSNFAAAQMDRRKT
jgi:hypothetical protein